MAEHAPYFLRTSMGEAKSYKDFRFQEIDSIASLFKFDADCYDRSKLSEYESTPYIPITLPSEEDVTKFTKRGVLIREAYEFIAKGSSIEECVKDLKLKQHKLTPYLTDTEKYWMMSVEGFGYKYNLEEGKKILDNFTFLDFKGPVRTSNVDNFFRVFIDHGRDNRNPGGVTRQVLFGRRICEGSRKAFNALTLKSRKYLGPTSTSADLALLMANQALVRPGTVSFDPFTGTGSILVACGYFGAYCFGTDIDWKTLHGKMRKATHTVVDNFKQYGLARPELMCSDNSIFPCNMKEFFDSIVCDPPYGVRAGAKKSGHVNGPKPKLDVSKFPSHFPASQHYPVEDVMDDLLDLAAKLLKVGGRLVFLLPTDDKFHTGELPKHPCLEFVASSEQVLRTHFSRHVVTIKKTRKHEPGMQVARRDRCDGNPPSFACIHEKVISSMPRDPFKNMTEDEIKSLSKNKLKKLQKIANRRKEMLAGAAFKKEKKEARRQKYLERKALQQEKAERKEQTANIDVDSKSTESRGNVNITDDGPIVKKHKSTHEP